MKVRTEDGVFVELTTEQALKTLEQRIHENRFAKLKSHGEDFEASIREHLQRLIDRIEVLEQKAEARK